MNHINIILNGHKSSYYIDPETQEVYNYRGILKPIVWGKNRRNKPYMMFSFNHLGKKIRILAHRLFAEYLLGGIPKGCVVNHKDGNTQNNNISNLEVVSEEENIRHEFETGLSKGKAYRKVRVERGGEVSFYKSINACCRATGLNPGNVSDYISRGGGVLKGFHVSEVN